VRDVRIPAKAFLVACGFSVLVAAPRPLQAQSESPISSQAPPGITPRDTADPNALANEAANPAAPLTQIQIRDILVPSIPGTDGATNLLQIQPVIPIGPFRRFPWVQLVKINVQFPTLPQPVGQSGFGDLDVFDLVTIKESWGRWGLGPSLVFPTASSRELGAGKWQAGPAMAVIYTGVKNLTAGAVFQNPISFAGDSGRAKVNELIIAPTLTYGLSKGWFAGLADFNWTFDWENGGDATLPLGVQVGKILRIGHQPFNVSVEIGRMAARPADTPNPGWIFGFEFSPIFNWHLGPGQKIHLRGKKKN
jgi:hypothetical protein